MSTNQVLLAKGRRPGEKPKRDLALVKSIGTGPARRVLPPALRTYLLEHGQALKTALEKRFGAPPPDPDDAIQSAILKFLEIDRAETVRDVRAFLYALARNLMLDELRKMKVRARYRSQEVVDSEAFTAHEQVSPESAVLHRERYRMLEKAIGRLDAEARQLLVLSRIENLSYAEIAARTGWSPAHISRSIQTSLGELSEYLNKNGLGDE
ncbi:sigma-70 family RNA polymerase sigma factor [uncultured Hyphomonas sp.]|uniref:RNA polymerase sigma factor n=1 Tax=uncultured Hyphomonas sp. TaxID=225298 RepID=UPI002AABCE08|nr:sigma-70 family RNA polymerase sigma factor [uncultured Hyphomonas sp.]